MEPDNNNGAGRSVSRGRGGSRGRDNSRLRGNSRRPGRFSDEHAAATVDAMPIVITRIMKDIGADNGMETQQAVATILAILVRLEPITITERKTDKKIYLQSYVTWEIPLLH